MVDPATAIGADGIERLLAVVRGELRRTLS
jgi:hypothetical protein